jgi:hypothetical protein
VVVQFTREMRNLFAPFAPSVLNVLLKWGFMSAKGGKVDPRILARYMTAAARGMASSLIEERRVILREMAGKNGG